MLTLLSSFTLNAQNGIIQIGAKPAGLGYTYTALFDAWSVFYNPAGIDQIPTSKALFSIENKFSISGLSTLGASFIASTKSGNFGASVFRFGDNIYNEQALGLTYSNSFGITSLGVRVNYFQYQSEISTTRNGLVIDFGGITRLTKQLNFGAYIRNINQANLSGNRDEKIPVILNAGISYKPTHELIINAEVEKDIDFDAGLRVGLAYTFLKRLQARSGILTYPFTNYFGLGFNSSRIQIDYALTRTPSLGISNQASVSYLLRKK